MEEIWKDIKGYEGLYQVSNLGRVKSMRKQKIMKPWITNKGYYMLSLWNSNGKSKYLVHRLVAIAFLNKKDGKYFCDHIDGNPLNNNVENLRWCTHKENCNFEIAKLRKIEKQKEIHSRDDWRKKQSEAKKNAMNRPEVKLKLKKAQKEIHKNPEWIQKQRERHHINRSVIQLDNNMKIIAEYISLNEANRFTGIDASSISKCCKGNAYSAGGYKWKYKE